MRSSHRHPIDSKHTSSAMATTSVAVLAIVLLLHVAALSAVPYLPQSARNAEFYDVVRQLLELNSGLQEQVRGNAWKRKSPGPLEIMFTFTTSYLVSMPKRY